MNFQNASNTNVNNNSVIKADALLGNGGKVIIWADDPTYFSVNASASGNYEEGKGRHEVGCTPLQMFQLQSRRAITVTIY